MVVVREVSGPECLAFQVRLDFSKRYSPAAAFTLLGRPIGFGAIRLSADKTSKRVFPQADSGEVHCSRR